jgi:hypothetical protein
MTELDSRFRGNGEKGGKWFFTNPSIRIQKEEYMMTQTYQFKAPPVIVNGPGAAKEVGNFAKGLGKKALLVTDPIWRRSDSPMR